MRDLLGFPLVASEHGGAMTNFILGVHAIMLVVFFAWGLWFVTALIRFRATRNPHADHRGLRTRLPYAAAAALALTEAALLFGVSLPFWHKTIAAAPDPAREDVYVVRVIGQQFQWNVHYPGADGVFGRTSPALVDDVLNPLGLDNDDPASADDITTLNQLHLPIGKIALIYLGSKDVIHSFFLPEFRVKQDAIPGMRVPVYFTPTMTSEEFRAKIGNPAREFEIACAQLCGINHYTMRGFVTIETQEQLDAWYAAQLEQKKEYAADDWWVEAAPETLPPTPAPAPEPQQP